MRTAHGGTGRAAIGGPRTASSRGARRGRARRGPARLLVDLKGVMCLWPKTERNGVSVLGWLGG